MASQRFVLLENRSTELYNSFLKDIIAYDEDGILDYNLITTRENQDRIRAYKLLVHAELEDYFEYMIERKIDNSFEAYRNLKEVDRVLLSCVCSLFTSTSF